MIRLGAVLYGSSSLTYLLIRVAVLTAGALLIMRAQMSIGDLVAFIELVGQVLGPLVAISGLFQQLQAATGAFERVQELMHEVPEVAEDPLAVDLPPVQREIRLERVSFSYADGEAGLRDVSLTIPAGARVALVGPSGAGKSTLLGLLLRLYDPKDGRVIFDGQDIREATLASVRGQQALVPQDTFLFNTTIGENIALAREGATEDEVVQAARAAAVHEVIQKTEQGYKTEVGERGARLSGGQRQRLAIARALLRDPRILVLDEATSALDPATEAAITQTLKEVGRGRTTVAITHRLSSVTDYDTIFVLDQGRLVEQGTHKELSARQGLYSRLYEEQQAGVLENLPLPIEPRRLARVPLFASLTVSQLAAVAMRVYVERYPAETVIVSQGEVADKLYVIADGEAEVLIEDRRGEPRRIKVLGARSYFGEIALLGDDSARRTATVRALTAVELYSLHKEDFLGLLSTHPAIAKDVQRLAQMRVEQAQRIGEMPGEPSVTPESTIRMERGTILDALKGF
jgi:ATP-binding cassette, subfamily B, bacterial